MSAASAGWARLDASELRARIAAREISAREAADEALARAEGLGAELGCFLALDREGARARADELDRALARGEPAGALCGVPVALKANLCQEGREASCGSRILAGWRAPYTATSVQRLLDAGAVPIGHANMDEFAMGSSGENSAFFPARNPWDRARTPGGSSSGAAAAVAAGIVPLALGSDTGGSVRQPAALCGIAALKPTWGRVSRYGLVAFGSSLDQVSPLARSARDLELALAVISGADERDATCAALPPFEPAPGASLAGLRVGVPREYLPETLAAEVRAAFERAVGVLVERGARRAEVSLPHTPFALPTYYVIATAEASSNLARFDGVRYGLRERAPAAEGVQEMMAATRGRGFGPEVKRRILLGTYVLSSGYRDAWYRRALQVRELVRADFERAFAEVDLIACPTTPTPAFLLGEKSADPIAMYTADVMTVPASLAGLPAASVPCGFARAPSESGGSQAELPLGLQLIGPAFAEARVLAAARAFEELSPCRGRIAPCALEGAAA